MIIRKYPTFLIGGHWVFSFNTDSLGWLCYQPFKGVNWALVMGLSLGDIIKGRALVLGLPLKPNIWALVLGLYANYFKPDQLPPPPPPSL